MSLNSPIRWATGLQDDIVSGYTPETYRPLKATCSAGNWAARASSMGTELAHVTFGRSIHYTLGRSQRLYHVEAHHKMEN